MTSVECVAQDSPEPKSNAQDSPEPKSNAQDSPEPKSNAQDSPEPDPPRRDERSLDYWAAQLSHERFLRRQSARRHLINGGRESVPILQKALDKGDLETVENAISVLSKIAEEEPPWQTDGALAALESIAETGFGTKVTLARSALQSFAESRGREAKIQLSDAGVFIGIDTVALGSRSSPRQIVRIDSDWDGDVELLAWLRWIDDINFVVIESATADPQVVGAVMKMPNLSTLLMIDCELTVPAVQALQKRPRIDVIELRYVRLNEELLAEFSDVHLRSSLHLMGTGVSEERIERLRVEMPGLEITMRRGGFLGVMCQTTSQDMCQVSQVTPGSGAAEAGLQAGDIVIRIDDVKITRFDDLQQQINTHVPGDEIAIRFRRGEDVLDTVATLKKLQSP